MSPLEGDGLAVGPVRDGSVTVVVVAYNHARFVDQALDAAFAQTYEDCAILIFDDASTDDTADVIQSYLEREDVAATFVRHDLNRGLCATLNEALDLVETEFVAIISADDWMEPDRIEAQVAAFDALGPDYGAVYSDANRVDINDQRLPTTYLEERLGQKAPDQGDVFVTFLRGELPPAPSVLVRRSVYDSVGRYDEGVQMEDYDMWLRVSRQFKFAYVPRALVNYRILPNSLYHSLLADLDNLRREYIFIGKKHLGVCAEGDDLILAQVADFSRTLYLNGARPSEVQPDLMLVARHVRSLKSFMFVALVTLRVPGRWVVRARSLARRPQ